MVPKVQKEEDVTHRPSKAYRDKKREQI